VKSSRKTDRQTARTWRRDKFEFSFDLMRKNSCKKLIKTLNDRFNIDYIGFNRSKMPHRDYKFSGNNIIKQFSKTRCEQPTQTNMAALCSPMRGGRPKALD